MNIVFLPYEHETTPMAYFADSLRKKLECGQFFFISDFFSQISSNQYTNKIIKELNFDNKNIYDILDEIKEISQIKENSKSIEVDYKFLKDIENKFINETINGLIFKDCYFYNFYHPRDSYYVPKNKELTFKFVEIIIKKIIKFLEYSKPQIVFSFGNNHLIRNLFYQLSHSFNYKFINLTHSRIGNRYYFCEKNSQVLTKKISDRAKDLKVNKDKINDKLIENFLKSIEQRIENNMGTYNVEDVYSPNEISLSIMKKISNSGFFKRSLYLLKDIYISKKLSSHRGFFRPPYFAEESYFYSYLKNYRNIFRINNFFNKKNLIYNGKFDFNFIYVPLHAFPENAVYANSGANSELQYLIRLSKVLPIDWKIVVKPSPLMFLAGGDVHPNSFYEEMNKINNCLIVSPKENSNLLLKKAKATASISGTNLIEAIILNKPAFRFGDYNLSSFNGIYKFEEVTFQNNLFQDNIDYKKKNYPLFQSIHENSFEINYDKYCYGFKKKDEEHFYNTFIKPLEENFLKFLKQT
jgi:hypothetical protein